MRHCPESDAARFLGGDLDTQERASFSDHLLTCTRCWDEVEQARRGRGLAEAARVAATAALRDRMRLLVESYQMQGDAESLPCRPIRLRRRLAVPVAAAAALALLLTAGPGSIEPPSLREAVADFNAEVLPGAQLPARSAPDLSALRLVNIGGGAGTYSDLEVDGFAYRDPANRRIVLYLSDQPFPEAPGARQLSGPNGPWIVARDGVIVLCARFPHSLLVIGEDDALVRSAAGALGAL